MDKPRVLADGFAFLEGPRWHDGQLWISDMHAQEVLTLGSNGEREVRFHVPNDPSGLGWLPDGRILVVSMQDRKLLRQEGDGLVEHADLSGLAAFHCNDMVVDEQGRAYVGNFGFDFASGAAPTGTVLTLVTPDGDARVVADDLKFPNGAVITPDGKTLVVGETYGGCMTAFDIAADGSLSNRRVWAQLEGATPDGCCLDAEGAIWVASPFAKTFLRVMEGGEVVERIETEQLAIACMLGGPDGRTLYLLTSPAVEGEECKKLRGAQVETVEVAAPRAGLP
jgi:sugar lactone lactonase YvrE